MDTKFHIAFKVKDIESTISFYHIILGCKLGRQTEHWVDFDFFGHQLSAHVSDAIPELDYCGRVENLKVPIPHFGCILDGKVFRDIQNRLEDHKVDFVFKPQKRYQNKKGEQQTMFILDFSKNAIEFKTFKNDHNIF
ncbi:VOC family protein [Aquimarina sp. MMG015]|uniref:VOC family protein n=1 Tax=Aquimarina sp. MMG015 TaxID=2822689 RepID=UPI001B3A4266|nr:VOC family protein [Aquimarina sp. MMG015]MBQ4804651.1 VOC family protein [Aquimarina sp. MMG015]